MFKINNLGSPWIYIGVPMCVLGQSMIFLLVLQKCTDLGYVSKEKNYLKLRGRSCSSFPVPFVCSRVLAAIPPAASVRQAGLKAQHITLLSFSEGGWRVSAVHQEWLIFHRKALLSARTRLHRDIIESSHWDVVMGAGYSSACLLCVSNGLCPWLWQVFSLWFGL